MNSTEFRNGTELLLDSDKDLHSVTFQIIKMLGRIFTLKECKEIER
jgi:hypothetical protein